MIKRVNGFDGKKVFDRKIGNWSVQIWRDGHDWYLVIWKYSSVEVWHLYEKRRLFKRGKKILNEFAEQRILTLEDIDKKDLSFWNEYCKALLNKRLIEEEYVLLKFYLENCEKECIDLGEEGEREKERLNRLKRNLERAEDRANFLSDIVNMFRW